ncbi:TPA: hypothetical protein ACK3Q6_005651 [Burkholderia cepacia]|jgi:hypothetical protein|uniref:Lipoprotein n=3 Tax=Burkholderia cepacia complex TaxID=87882 RepID=A0A250LKV6_9BURK|nr:MULTISPECIES: hypothetical protein [Burkholderia]KKL36516.1 hypothetical protein WR31_25395 [Burkholderia contaminans LMG 23361]MBA9839178.1 hypothetical protein [Burkholderia contaminans]MBA9864488.1 hypothetical protein [Burkholderia contaminans]MBA9929496.1 hypothetical protein [Burkholderia contaminans]MBX3822801.1 hypothetical protein [Burkholderia contaminans]
MKAMGRGFRGTLVQCGAVAGCALLLTGCGDRSISGAYVLSSKTEADLLQITETPDHHFSGTLRHTVLGNDGTLSSGSTNVSGSVDGDSITLTLLATPLPIGQNFSGTVTSGGIELTLSDGNRTAVQHFAKSKPADFDSAVAQLSRAGEPVIAARQRGQAVEHLNRGVTSLSTNLERFVSKAQERIERLPRVQAYYDQAIATEEAKLDRARRLASTGNSVAQGQANVIVGQMGVDKAQISITDDTIERAINDEKAAEATLNAEIAQRRPQCVGAGSTGSDHVRPDMGPCKGFERAVAAYNSILPALHKALVLAAQAKTHGHDQLATVWQAADAIQ